MSKQPAAAAAEIEATEGSGNVFEDLGFEDADELQAKAELTRQLQRILKRQRLSQRAAAKLLGIAQPDVSALLNGRHTGFSLTRLMTLLTRLDRDVDIVIRRKPEARARSRLMVHAEE
jgi:predicted XRE-type DNA-binding protein